MSMLNKMMMAAKGSKPKSQQATKATTKKKIQPKGGKKK